MPLHLVRSASGPAPLQRQLLVLLLTLNLLALLAIQGLLAPVRTAWPALIGLAGLNVLAGLLWLHRALLPLRRLLRFARGLGQWPGTQLDTPPGSREVQALQQALNAASLKLGQQLEAQRASEERIQAILASVPDAMLGLDAEGCIVQANPALTRVFGLAPQDAVGQPLGSLLPGWDAAALRRVARGGIHVSGSSNRMVREAVQARRIDGTAFPVSLALTALPEGGPLRYTCLVHDATEDRAAQLSLEQAARALAALPAGVLLLRLQPRPDGGMDERIVQINPSAAQRLGREAWDLIGEPCLDLARPGDPGTPADAAALAAALGRGPLTLRLLSCNGSSLGLHLETLPPDEDGPAQAPDASGPLLAVGLLTAEVVVLA